MIYWRFFIVLRHFGRNLFYALQHLIYYFGINIHIKFAGKNSGRIFYHFKILRSENIRISSLPIDKASAGKVVIAAVFHINIIRKRRINKRGLHKHFVAAIGKAKDFFKWLTRLCYIGSKCARYAEPIAALLHLYIFIFKPVYAAEHLHPEGNLRQNFCEKISAAAEKMIIFYSALGAFGNIIRREMHKLPPCVFIKKAMNFIV